MRPEHRVRRQPLPGEWPRTVKGPRAGPVPSRSMGPPLMSRSTRPRVATVLSVTTGNGIDWDCRGRRRFPASRSQAASMTLLDRTPAAPPSRMSPGTACSRAFFACTAASRSDEGLAPRLEYAARDSSPPRLVATTRHSAMPVSAENARAVAPVAANGQDMNVAVVSLQCLPRSLPRPAPVKRERKDQGQHAAVSQLAMRQVHEVSTRGRRCRCQKSPPPSGASGSSLAASSWRRAEPRERRNRDVGMAGLVVRGTRETGDS